MSEFQLPPVKILVSLDDLRRFLKDDAAWAELTIHRVRHEVRSEWLVSTIRDLLARKPNREPVREEKREGHTVTIVNLGHDTVYNADVKAAALEALGLPPESAHEEGDRLSALIYAAQGYRRHDDLVARGFVPLTQELVDSLELETRLETPGETAFKIGELNGKRYCFKLRSKFRGLNPRGQPVKVLGKKTRKKGAKA